MVDQRKSTNGGLMFDVYLYDHWVGRVAGDTPGLTRQSLRESHPDHLVRVENMVLVPDYGDPHPDNTYEALMGRHVAGSALHWSKSNEIDRAEKMADAMNSLEVNEAAKQHVLATLQKPFAI